LAAGFGRRAIDHRIAVGRLHPIHRSVYAVGYRRLAVKGRWVAAVLACGPGALLSHRSAAALWGFRATGAASVDVTVRAGNRAPRPGIAIHLTRHLPDVEVAKHEAIPVTSVARTLLDLAGLLSPTQLQRAVAETDRLELLDLGTLDLALDRGRGRRGTRALRAVLEAHRSPAPITRSELERRFLDLCRAAGLPLPSLNAFVAGLEVDAVWPRAHVVVELDGFAYHRDRVAFERDRERDAMLQLAGYRVLRFTHRRLEVAPDEAIETVRGLLRDRA
jgi:hypothetical protein